MMAAAQPFLSGAISKTVNLPPRLHGRGRRERLHGVVEARASRRSRSTATAASAPSRCRPARSTRASASRRRPWRPAGATCRWRRSRRRRAAGGRAAQAARRAAVVHPQVLGRRPRGLHPRRPVRERPAGRDLRAHGQGGLDHLGPDGQLRHGDLAGAAARRAAASCWSTSSRAPASSRPASPATRRSRAPRRSWTTCSAGWARSSCRTRTRRRRRQRASTPAATSSASPRWSTRRQHRQRSTVSGSATRRRSTAPTQRPPTATATANGNGNGNGNGNTRPRPTFSFIARTDAPTCAECGSIMVPNGSCHKCINCGTTSGCS